MLVLHVGDRPFHRECRFEEARRRGIRAEHAESGTEAMEFLRLYDYDIVLLDLKLPDISGQDLIRRIRAARISVPILACADVVPTHVRVQALDAGADDVLVGLCDMDELLARLRAIVRRMSGHANSSLCFGGVELNMNSRDVFVHGTRLALSRREYHALELLLLRRGTILTKTAFLNHLYCGSEEPEMKTIDVIVCRLRKKLADAGLPTLIDTVWGSGYIVREMDAIPAMLPRAMPAWTANALAA